MELHKYQKDALIFCLERPKSYLALDMGLGKTAISLYWSKEVLKETNGILVVAPLRTIYSSWPDEIKLWTPELSSVVLHGPKKAEALTENVDLYLINYEGLPWLYDQIKRRFKATGKIPFRAVIFDEGSMMKSSTTKRFKILKKMRVIFPKWMMILSGTPAPNSLLDLWSQYFILDGGQRLQPFISHYKQRFFYQVDRMGFVWNIRSGSKEIIYKAIEDITYRLDAEDHLDLPERIDNVIKIKMPQKAKQQYDKLEKEFFFELEENKSVDIFNSASLSMKLRQFVQGAIYTDILVQGNIYEKQDGSRSTGPRDFKIVHQEKLKVLTSLVEESSGQGVLCAIQFKFELNIIKKKFPKAPVIAGGVSAQEAGRLIKLWNKGEIPLLLCHPASLSHGVNLQTGSHLIVWYGLTWSLEQYLQFNARLHRQGQLNTVIIHHLVMEDTIDVNVMKALKKKFKGQQDLLNYLKEHRKEES